jgi:hypothetical protein
VVEAAAGDELGEEATTEDELEERVTTETTVLVATGEELDEGLTTETTVATGDELDNGEETGLELRLTVEVSTWVVVTRGVADVFGQELTVCVKGLVTGNVEVAVLVRVVVAEAEVTVVVAAGWGAAVAVYVLVEVTNCVVEATVRGPGDVPKVAVKGRGV